MNLASIENPNTHSSGSTADSLIAFNQRITNAVSATDTKLPSEGLRQLSNGLFSGDPTSKQKLMAIMSNSDPTLHYDSHTRVWALIYLSEDKDPASLLAVAEQLLSDDPDVINAAYHQLPRNLRPQNFDFTATPTDQSREQIRKYLAKLPQLMALGNANAPNSSENYLPPPQDRK